jgi:hypothetical protein
VKEWKLVEEAKKKLSERVCFEDTGTSGRTEQSGIPKKKKKKRLQ